MTCTVDTDDLGAFREQGFDDVFVGWVPMNAVAPATDFTRFGRIAGKPFGSAPTSRCM